jgi:hypothetical protein
MKSYKHPWVTEEDFVYLEGVAKQLFWGDDPPESVQAPSGWRFRWVAGYDRSGLPEVVYFSSTGEGSSVMFRKD